MSFAVLALAVAVFGIGLAEFVIQGLLPDISADFGVSIPTTGLLVTGYALSVAVGGPIVVILVNRLGRKAALLSLMGLFIFGNVLCAIAPTFGLLMCARIITSLCHGSFFGIAAVVAASIVAEDRRASAVSLMFSGLTVANILGVPSGTALGHAAGWRWTFWAVAFIGVVGIAGIAKLLPGTADTGQATTITRELRVVRERQVLIGLLVAMLVTTAVFPFITYIAPFVIEVTGVSAQTVPWMLLAFGLGGTVGMFAGGRLADLKRVPTLIGTLAFLVLVYVAIFLGERSPGLTWVSIFLAATGFATVPPLQMIVVTAAKEAPNLASTLLQSAFNIGISLGSLIGGTALSLRLDYRHLPLICVVLSMVALGVARFPLVWAIRSAAAHSSST
jgi:DHA1 family inner membrane transport protein